MRMSRSKKNADEITGMKPMLSNIERILEILEITNVNARFLCATTCCDVLYFLCTTCASSHGHRLLGAGSS